VDTYILTFDFIHDVLDSCTGTSRFFIDCGYGNLQIK